MNPNPRISVCVATYRGAPWVADQLHSILEQLDQDDEVVVVDDASPDDTVSRIREIDVPRIRLITRGRNQGYVRSFEQALQAARGELLLLADQDDLWEPGRVAAMADALDTADVVATNLATVDGPDSIRGPYGQADWSLRSASSDHGRRNCLGILIGNMPYYGCAMGLRRDCLDELLPFPEWLTESHDLWIALYGNLTRRMRHLEIRSVRRRFHQDNASSHRPRGPVQVARSRWMLLRAIRELQRRRAQRPADPAPHSC